MNDTIITAKFNLGQIVATRGVLAIAEQSELLPFLQRHASGDWGIVGEEDSQTNNDALKDGDRLLSAYLLPKSAKRDTEEKIWIITEWDRSATTILLPEEY